METIKIKVENTLKKIIKEMYNIEVDIAFERPKHKEQGDFSCNVAMQLARQARMAPIKIANAIVEKIDKDNLNIEKIEIAGAGFINFFVVKESISKVISKILNDDNYGFNQYGAGIKVNLEFVSANPTGDLHLGHTRGAAAGDSIARILKAAGYDVTKEFYFNDGGNQINNLAKSVETRYKQLFDPNLEMIKDGYFGENIIEVAKKIKLEVGDKYLSEDGYEHFKTFAVNYFMEKIVDDLEKFRVNFDVFTNEQTLRNNGDIEKILEFLRQQGEIYEKDDATWLKTEKYGDDKDRVLVKSDKSYTYIVPDLAYHVDKYNRGYDILIDLLGGDHHGYIRRLKAGMQALGKNPDTLHVELLQMVRLVQDGKEVKLSKRTGNSYSLRDFIEEVGVDATRYFFVMRSLDTHMDFDLDLALSNSNENPVYYAQYAHARMASIISNAKVKEFEYANKLVYKTLISEKEIELLKLISEYTNVIIDAATKRAPHKITNYINKLASAFHSFYNDVKVITDDKFESEEKLALIKATQITLRNALDLVGVSAPCNM